MIRAGKVPPPHKSAPSHPPWLVWGCWGGLSLGRGGVLVAVSSWGYPGWHFGASGTWYPWGSVLPPLDIPCLGSPCVAVPAMAELGTVSPRAKRPRRDSSGDRRLSATRAGARRRTRSQQTEGERGQRYQLRGRDPWDSVPRSPLVPVTPGKGRLAKLRLQGGCHSPGSAPPGLGGCGECVPPGTIAAWGKGGCPELC